MARLTVQLTASKNLHYKLVLSLNLSSYTQDVSPKDLPKKPSSISMMAQRKLVVKGVTPNGKAIETARGMVSPPNSNQLQATEEIGSSSPQEPAASIQPTQQREDQHL